jgi:cell division protein FtsL
VTAPAQPLAFPGAVSGLRVVGGTRVRRRPRVGAWVLLAVVLSAAFFLLIYSRIALDRSAFVLQEVTRQMEVEDARYWQLRLEAAELQAPERIVARAQEMGLVYPGSVQTIEVPGMGSLGSGAEDRWADLKALLGAQP